MSPSAQKKTAKKAITTASPAPASQTPALIAYHMSHAPKGTPPVLMPIGAAFAHDDGEGFTLQLHLMPTAGGRIVLRKPKATKLA